MILVEEVFKRKREVIKEVTIANDFITIKVLTLGATVTHLSLMSDHQNIILAYEDKKQYLDNQAKLSLLRTNLPIDLASANFELLAEDDERFPVAVFSKTVADDIFRITIRLVKNSVIVDHVILSKEKKPLSMSGQWYFNLDGEKSVLNHILEVNANMVLARDQQLNLLDEKIHVVNSAFDFRTARPIATQVKKGNPQFDFTHGLNHFYELDNTKKMVVLFSTKSKKSVNIDTTCEGVFVDTLNEVNWPLKMEDGQLLGVNQGLGIAPCNLDQSTLFFESRTTYTLK